MTSDLTATLPCELRDLKKKLELYFHRIQMTVLQFDKIFENYFYQQFSFPPFIPPLRRFKGVKSYSTLQAAS